MLSIAITTESAETISISATPVFTPKEGVVIHA
jgi:hypothetical protein